MAIGRTNIGLGKGLNGIYVYKMYDWSDSTNKPTFSVTQGSLSFSVPTVGTVHSAPIPTIETQQTIGANQGTLTFPSSITRGYKYAQMELSTYATAYTSPQSSIVYNANNEILLQSTNGSDYRVIDNIPIIEGTYLIRFYGYIYAHASGGNAHVSIGSIIFHN